jgi:hypothetical protein
MRISAPSAYGAQAPFGKAGAQTPAPGADTLYGHVMWRKSATCEGYLGLLPQLGVTFARVIRRAASLAIVGQPPMDWRGRVCRPYVAASAASRSRVNAISSPFTRWPMCG